MEHRTANPNDTSPIPREELLALLGRLRRGEKEHAEADDRATPIVLHRAAIDAWLGAKRGA